MVLEWLRERFAKPCRVGSIPTHASIFFVLPENHPLPAGCFEPDEGMSAEKFAEKSGNELDKTSKRGYITGYSIETNKKCSGGGMADALA